MYARKAGNDNNNTQSTKNTTKIDKADHRNIFREPGIHYNQQHHRQKYTNTRKKATNVGKSSRIMRTRLNQQQQQ